jgi:arylsulfatase
LDRNRPTNLDELYRWNEVELFDLQADPDEMVNLAADRSASENLILAMNAKLDAAIKAEIGVDDGREMPNIPLVDWNVERVDIQ